MSWQLLPVIESKLDWTLTETVTGSFFKLTYTTNSTKPQDLRAVICQVLNDAGTDIYCDDRRLNFRPEVQGVVFKVPEGITERRIAVKRIDPLPDSWDIQIEVLEGVNEISLPIEMSDVTGLLEALDARVSRLEFVSHIADTENPHNVTAAQVGAERPGAGAAAAVSAIASHVEHLDPHTQYAENTQITQLETALAGKETLGTAAQLIANLTASQIPLILPTATIIDYEGTIAANGILTANGLIWLLLDGATIGNATSGATRYADAKAQTLFERLWSNTNLLIQTSNGVSSTRGTTALEDFNANKRLNLPDPRGRVIISSGTGANLTIRTRGQTGGAETHVLSTLEIPSHSHKNAMRSDQNITGGNIQIGTTGNTFAFHSTGTTGTQTVSGADSNSGLTGGGQPHNNMQPFYVSSGKLILAGKAQ